MCYEDDGIQGAQLQLGLRNMLSLVVEAQEADHPWAKGEPYSVTVHTTLDLPFISIIQSGAEPLAGSTSKHSNW